MKNRIFLKLLAAFVVVIAVATFIFGFTLRGAWESSLRTEIERNLTQKTLLFAHRVETVRNHSLPDVAAQEGQAAGASATIIDVTGRVLAASESDPASLENQAERKEFAAALAGNIGTDERRSATLGIPFLYIAAPVSGGAVRLAYPLSDVEAISGKVFRGLAISSALAFIVALVVAAVAATWTARRLEHIVDIAGRIAEGDLRARVDDASQDEIGRVLGAPNSDRFPEYLNLNLHLEWTTHLFGYRFALRGGLNNITDHKNYTVVNNVFGSPNFLTFYGSTGRHFVVRLRWLGRVKT